MSVFNLFGPSADERAREQQNFLDDAEDVLGAPPAAALSRMSSFATDLPASPPLPPPDAFSAAYYFTVAMERACVHSVEHFSEAADWRDGVCERFFDALQLPEGERRQLRSAGARAALAGPPAFPGDEAERHAALEQALAFAVRERRGYDARARQACLEMARGWGVSFAAAETRLAATLAALVAPAAPAAGPSRPRGLLEPEGGWAEALKGKWPAALAALAVGGLVTAGGAAALVPLLAGAAKLVTVPAFLSLKGLSLCISGLFGAGGATLTGYRVDRATAGLAQFEFRTVPLQEGGGPEPPPALHAAIAVPGFVPLAPPCGPPAAGRPLDSLAADWAPTLRALELSPEGYVLAWEGEALADLGELVGGLARGEVAAALSLADVVGGTWARSQAKCEKAAAALAGVLRQRLAGRRPVSLVGASMGARLVLLALEELHRSRSPGLVMHAVLLGAPALAADGDAWRRARAVVAGRLLAVRSARDGELRAAARVALLGRDPAGLVPVGLPGVEDVDAAELVPSHAAYGPAGGAAEPLPALAARLAALLEPPGPAPGPDGEGGPDPGAPPAPPSPEGGGHAEGAQAGTRGAA